MRLATLSRFVTLSVRLAAGLGVLAVGLAGLAGLPGMTPSASARSAPTDTIAAGPCGWLGSTVDCYMTADPAGGASSQRPSRGTIGRSGRGPSEDIHVDVVVRNILGARLAGANVTVHATAMGGSTFRWDDGLSPAGDSAEDPQVLVSDAAGRANFRWDEGGVSSAVGAFPNLDFTVFTQGPGPGAPIALPGCAPQLSVVSYDLDGSGGVDLTDIALFASQLNTSLDQQ